MFRKGSDNMNRRILTALILNILVVIATTAITVSYYFHSNNPLVETGLDSYKFFTTDSNILAAISALVMIPYEIGILRGKRDKLPHAAVVLKFVGMVAVMLTFLTVIFLLLPVYDAGFLLLGTAFHMHLAGPLAALFTFVFLETDSEITLPESLLALLPTVIYGSVYTTEVLIIGAENGGWVDFYTLNRGGYWYVSIIMMLAATYMIGFVTRLAHNKISKTRSKNNA